MWGSELLPWWNLAAGHGRAPEPGPEGVDAGRKRRLRKLRPQGLAAAGAFAITNAQAETRSVSAWQDPNGNMAVVLRGYHGRTDGVIIVSDMTTADVRVIV